jgi:hypothetical protein
MDRPRGSRMQLNERPRKTLELKRQQRDLEHVLRRPVEAATKSGRSFCLIGKNVANQVDVSILAGHEWDHRGF